MNKNEWYLLWFGLIGAPIISVVCFIVGDIYIYFAYYCVFVSAVTWSWFILTWIKIQRKIRWKLNNGYEYDFDRKKWNDPKVKSRR